MSTWVVGHGMVPLLVPEVFPPVDFFMQVHVFIGDTWHHPYISTCFVDNVFTFLVIKDTAFVTSSIGSRSRCHYIYSITIKQCVVCVSGCAYVCVWLCTPICLIFL